MLLNKREITYFTKEVINKYLSLILVQLGFREKPPNLTVKIGDTYDYALGACFAHLTDKSELSEAVIVLYPFNMLWMKIGCRLRLPALCRFSRILFEKKLLYVLAHELRHYWQYHSGQHREKRRLSKLLPGRIDLMEIDAEKWARSFLAIYGITPKISSLSY